MNRIACALMILAMPPAAVAQDGGNAQLPPQTTLPIEFTRTISAQKARVGDAIEAKTYQTVRLGNGVVIPAGSRVNAHVAEAAGFHYDKTPYAKQVRGLLTVHFDSVETKGMKLPLTVTVRALAGVFASNDAQTPVATDMDPLGTRTLVGGDLMVPSQNEVRNLDGDVVGYNHRDGVYAHLIANGRCDSGSTEVSMGIFSTSACGVYGFGDVSATEFGSAAHPSTLSLTSRRGAPMVYKNTTALLEVLPQEQALVARVVR